MSRFYYGAYQDWGLYRHTHVDLSESACRRSKLSSNASHKIESDPIEQ